MNKKYLATVSIDEAELNAILSELDEAKETIYKCYSRLKELGFVEIKAKKETASGN